MLTLAVGLRTQGGFSPPPPPLCTSTFIFSSRLASFAFVEDGAGSTIKQSVAAHFGLPPKGREWWVVPLRALSSFLSLG